MIRRCRLEENTRIFANLRKPNFILVEYSIDYKAIESYSEQLTERLLEGFFNVNETISGADIRRFTGMEQVNYFILRNLFQAWVEESQKIRAPYFDYEQEDVQEAMRVFMNKLSHHIKVNREHFEPLLYNALFDSLEFVLSPRTFVMERVLGNEKETLTHQEIADNGKYFRLNKGLWEAYVKRLEEVPNPLSGDDAKAVFEVVLGEEEEKLDSVEEFFENLSLLSPCTLEDFLVQESMPEKPVENEVQPAPEVRPAEVPVENQNPTPVEEDRNPVLNDSFKDEVRTNTINAGFEEAKVQSIREVINLNLQYAFVNRLFDGNREEYDQALHNVDSSQTYDEAMENLLETYALKYDWSVKEEEASSLFHLIAKRF